jgi:hypothetical protein
MPFRAYYLSPEGDRWRDLSEEEIRAGYESRQGLVFGLEMERYGLQPSLGPGDDKSGIITYTGGTTNGS